MKKEMSVEEVELNEVEVEYVGLRQRYEGNIIVSWIFIFASVGLCIGYVCGSEVACYLGAGVGIALGSVVGNYISSKVFKTKISKDKLV